MREQDPFSDIDVDTSQETENCDFTIDAQEAARILDVNRTRLSQLTTKGVFPFQRKKVNQHNRIFYRLNDILSYQRQHTYGNWSPNQSFQEQVRRYEQSVIKGKKEEESTGKTVDALEIENVLQKTESPILTKTQIPRFQKNSVPKKTANTVYEEQKKARDQEKLARKINEIDDVKDEIAGVLKKLELYQLKLEKNFHDVQLQFQTIASLCNEKSIKKASDFLPTKSQKIKSFPYQKNITKNKKYLPHFKRTSCPENQDSNDSI